MRYGRDNNDRFSPLSLLLLLAKAASAASFHLHSATSQRRIIIDINRNIAQRSSSTTTVTFQASSDDQNDALSNSSTRSQINSQISQRKSLNTSSKIRSQIVHVLKEKKKDLLSDKSKLLKQHPQSTVANDNEMRKSLSLSDEQMIREALLSSRLLLPFLNRTIIGPSTIEGAGRGLFATENIRKGEVITLYPGDALLYELEDGGDNDLDEEYNEEYGKDSDDEEDEYIEEIVLWGAHVTDKDIWDDDTVFDGSETKPALTSYAVSVDDYYSVMGHPSLDDDPAYYGHFANDGAGHLAFEKKSNMESEMKIRGVEENISAYVLKSLEMANAMHRALEVGELGGSHMATVATRDVEKGEEILVTYGPDFWLGFEC